MVGVRRSRRVGCSVCGRGGKDGGAVVWVVVLRIEIGHDDWWMVGSTLVMFVLWKNEEVEWPMANGVWVHDK